MEKFYLLLQQQLIKNNHQNDFILYFNSNNLALIPKYLNKKNIDKFINAHEEQNGEISINERTFTTMYNS